MNDLRRATASLLAVSDSDELTPTPEVTGGGVMSLAYFNSMLYQIAVKDGYKGTLTEFADSFADALNGNAVIETAPSKDNFPKEGEEGALYLDTSTGKIYYYEDGEYKQANADTEVTEEKLEQMVKDILGADPDVTDKLITEGTKEYLKENPDALDNAVISYVDKKPEIITGAVESYLENNPESMNDAIKDYLDKDCDTLDKVVQDTITENPHIIVEGVENYIAENPNEIEKIVDGYMDDNAEKLVGEYLEDNFDKMTAITDKIEDAIDNKLDDIISQHFEKEVSEEDADKEDNEIIEDALGSTKPSKNDIFVIKRPIVPGNFEYTSYYFDGEKWCAMNGNVSADNVYFNKDFIVTETIGTIKQLDNGRATLKAYGKNLTQVLSELLAQEKMPNIVMPYVTITSTTAKNYEAGTMIKPAWTAQFHAGEYEFGPETNVELIKWDITNNITNEKSSDGSGRFNMFEVEDDTNMTITATATYGAGSIPLTNLGAGVVESRIPAGQIAKKSAVMRGYRKTFFGATLDVEPINQDDVRTLESSTAGMKDGSTFSINVGQGAKRVIIAYPANLGDLSSVKEHGKFEIAKTFTQTTMEIEGANGYKPIEYKVYTKIFDKEREEDSVYNVII